MMKGGWEKGGNLATDELAGEMSLFLSTTKGEGADVGVG